jgi:hypothetical protein
MQVETEDPNFNVAIDVIGLCCFDESSSERLVPTRLGLVRGVAAEVHGPHERRARPSLMSSEISRTHRSENNSYFGEVLFFLF